MKELRNKTHPIVACVPMYDSMGQGLVYYTNNITGGDPVPQFPRPVYLHRLSVSLLDDQGNLYDFKGLDSCWVFEIVCVLTELV